LTLPGACAAQVLDQAFSAARDREVVSATVSLAANPLDTNRQRVIVSLRIDSAANDREAAIRRVQMSILDSLPAAGFDLVRRYQHLPQLVMSADAETMRQIVRHPAVIDVRPDVPLAPSDDAP
jgi:hypothetical protein